MIRRDNIRTWMACHHGLQVYIALVVTAELVVQVAK